MPEGVNLLTNREKYGRSQSIVQSGRNEPVLIVTRRLVHTLQVQEASSLKTVSGMPSQFWWNHLQQISHSAIFIPGSFLSAGLQGMQQ